MNFKKFISGVSALTIAASAFAGMAVTANAADAVSKQYTVTENFDNAVLNAGSLKSTSGDKAGTLTGTNFKTDVTTYVGWSNQRSIAFLDAGASAVDGDYSLAVGADPDGSGNAQDTYMTLDMVNALSGTDSNLVTVNFKWYAGEFATDTNNSFVQLKDSSGNEIFTLRWRRSQYNFTLNDVVVGSNSASYSNKWNDVTATLDFTNHKITSISWTNSVGTLSTSNVSFVSDAAANLGKFVVGIKKNKNAQTTNQSKLDNISVTGYADSYKVSIPVTDGTAPVTGATVTLTGVAANTDTITATDENNDGTYEAYVPAGSTPSYSVTKEGYTSATGALEAVADDVTTADQVITEQLDAGYVINTTPYAAISVDGAAAVSTGRTGTYTFALGTTGEHSVVITKTGYQTVNTTVTAANNGSTTLNLTLNDGTYFSEDFANVNDNYGFNAASGVTVAGGKLTLVPTTNNAADMATTFANSVDYDGKCITMNISATSGSANNQMNAYLAGTSLRFYVYGEKLKIYGSSNTGIEFTRPNGTFTVQITKNLKTQANSLYVNGVRVDGTLYNSDTTITGITAAQQKNNNFSFTIDDIAVTNMPSTAAITIDDDGTTSSTTYIAGTSFTLPEAAGKDGYTFDGWSDGENTYAAGTALTADATKTYTAVYTQIAAPTSTFVAADWTSDVPTWRAEGNKLTDTFDVSVYGYKTDITGNAGYTYTVKGYIESAESGKSTTLTFGTITDASPMVFYLVTDEALDTSASNVYCE